MDALIMVEKSDTGAYQIMPGAEPMDADTFRADGADIEWQCDLKGWEPWTTFVMVYVPIGGGWDEVPCFRGEI